MHKTYSTCTHKLFQSDPKDQFHRWDQLAKKLVETESAVQYQERY